MSWELFRRELEGLEGEHRIVRARQIIAVNQSAFPDDPPDWLLAAASSRAMEATPMRSITTPVSRQDKGGSTAASRAALTRRLEAVERSTKRTFEELDRRRAEPLVDRAVEDGRIEASDRGRWVRQFSVSFELASSMLAALPPNRQRANRNHYAEDAVDDAAYRADTAARLGIPVEQVL